MPQIGRISTSILLLDRGRIAEYSSDLSLVVEQYYNQFTLEKKSIQGFENINSLKIQLNGRSVEKQPVILRWMNFFELKMQFFNNFNLNDLSVSIVIIDRDQKIVANALLKVI